MPQFKRLRPDRADNHYRCIFSSFIIRMSLVSLGQCLIKICLLINRRFFKSLNYGFMALGCPETRMVLLYVLICMSVTLMWFPHERFCDHERNSWWAEAVRQATISYHEFTIVHGDLSFYHVLFILKVDRSLGGYQFISSLPLKWYSVEIRARNEKNVVFLTRDIYSRNESS